MKPVMISVPKKEQKRVTKMLRNAVISSVQDYIYTLIAKDRLREEKNERRKANKIKAKAS